MSTPQEQAPTDWIRDAIATLVHNLPYDNELANADLLLGLGYELIDHSKQLRIAHHRRNAESLT